MWAQAPAAVVACPDTMPTLPGRPPATPPQVQPNGPAVERPRLTAAMVATAMSTCLREPVTGIETLAGYVGNQDFMIHTARGDFVLKAGDRREMAAEAWACERVRAVGVAAPEVVALDVDQRTLPAPFLVLRRLPGGALTDRRDPALVEAGRQLRIVHSIPIDGYGFLSAGDGEANAPTGSHPTWAEFTAEAAGCLAELVAHDVISERFAIRLQSALQAHGHDVRFEGPGRLLHGDLKPPHVFADAGRLVGIIDWGDTAAGDPRYDLARFSLAGEEYLGPLLTGYELELTSDLRTTFAVYRLIRVTTILRDELRAGGDWFATYRAAIESDLVLLGR